LGGRRHYHLDHLGTPRLVTADNGLRISLHDYFPFGDESTPVSQEVAAGYDREDPLKFTGHERDYAWGMGAEDPHSIDDMHARYESPSLGRFLAVDPVDGAPGSPQSWNHYAYVGNNPLNFNDPSGMESSAITCNDDGCSITVTPDPEPPVPQLPKGPPEHNFWDTMADLFTAYLRLGNKIRPYLPKPTPHRPGEPRILAGTVITGGFGAEVGEAEEVAVTFSEQEGVAHGARHLEGSGLTEAETRAAIAEDVQTEVARSSSVSGTFWGRVAINGVTILYKAIVRSGAVNIGTFWPIQ
jgi:RHS repeat-associated protein